MTVGLLLAAAPAQAWYVDISITGAGRVYETSDANELDEHCPDSIEGFASPGNTPTGSLGASCRAGDAGGDYGSGWVVRYVAEAAPGYRFAGWSSDGRTTPGPVICDGSGGSSSYAGAGCQFATWENLQVRARFVDDTNPTMSSLSGPNAPVSGPASFTFAAAADPTFHRFECRVASVHEWQTCTSGRQENPASSGTYTFEVRAVDWSDNRSATSSWEWTVDKFAPETQLDSLSGPTGTVPSTSASFSFSGSGDAVGFRCTLDGVSASCSSPKTYTGLSQGPHQFAVQAVDAAGNVDASPATRSWTVDTVAPQTSIDAGPAGGSVSSSSSTSFEFDSTEAGTFECRLDGGAWSSCVSPRALTGLAEGAHTFEVRAVDAAGNVDASPATRSWTVDTVAPQTSIDAGPAGGSVSSSSSTSFEFDSTEAGTFECRLDGGAWSSCVSPRALTGLAEGAHTFEVRAVDAAGNVDASPATRSWTVDLPDATPPAPTPTQPIPPAPSPAPAPSAEPASMDVRVKFRHRVRAGRTLVRTLKLTGLPAGATVRVTCKDKRKGCAFKAKKVRASSSSVALTGLFGTRSLAAGAVVSLRITAPDHEPTTFRYKTRTGTKSPAGGEVAARPAPASHLTSSTPWAPLSASIITWLTRG